jgi:hypothetical protein
LTSEKFNYKIENTMKEQIKDLAKKTADDIANKPISRKEALKKTGYVALTAASMMLLLNNPAQANRRRGESNSGPEGSARDC